MNTLVARADMLTFTTHQSAKLLSSPATSDQQRATFFSPPATSDQRPAPPLPSPATSDQRPATNSAGFTLIEVIGVLAVMATLMAIVTPTVLDQMDRAVQEAEGKNLHVIAQGVEMYLRENKAWPANLAALSPNYVPLGNTQLTLNDRGFPRYFVVHPDISAYSNVTGIGATSLPDARFLLISNISGDANPLISNGVEFNTWWNTDETTTPDLKIFRGHIGKLFHLLSLSAVGAGGSYRIDGTKTNSGGSLLTSHGNYHLVGTVVEVDEGNNFSPGNIAFGFTLSSDAGYQFDPTCSAGSQWHVLGSSCS